MNVSLYSLIRNPRFWQGYCVLHVDDLFVGWFVAQPNRQTINALRSRFPFSQMEKESRRILW